MDQTALARAVKWVWWAQTGDEGWRKAAWTFLLLQPSALLEKHQCYSLHAETENPLGVKR